MILVEEAAQPSVFALEPGTKCFYCSEVIRAVAVQWRGASGEIFLHPPCVVELTIRLFRDVHEIECGTGHHVTRSER